MDKFIKEINDGVTFIDLSYNELSDEDFKKISIVLSTNNTLKILIFVVIILVIKV
jgi:hypothetical protein